MSNGNTDKLYEFLCDIDQVRLANKFSGVVDNPTNATVRKVTGDICIKLYTIITRSKKPSDMSLLTYDDQLGKAVSCLQRADHADSLNRWAADVVSSYVPVHKRIEG